MIAKRVSVVGFDRNNEGGKGPLSVTHTNAIARLKESLCFVRARPGMPSSKEAVLLRQDLPQTLTFTDPGCEASRRRRRSLSTLEALYFRLPDGTPLFADKADVALEVDVERCAAVEPLFSGDFGLGELRDKAFASTLSEAILEAATDLVAGKAWGGGAGGAAGGGGSGASTQHPKLLPVVLVGGLSRLPGFATRVKRDLRTIVSQDNHFAQELATSIGVIQSEEAPKTGKARARLGTARTDPRFDCRTCDARFPYGKDNEFAPTFEDTAIWRGASIRAEAAMTDPKPVLGVNRRESAVTRLVVTREEYQESGCAMEGVFFHQDGAEESWAFW